MNTQLVLVAEPRARHNNPHTSQAAAESVVPVAGYLEQQIVKVAAEFGPVTADFVAQTLMRREPGRWIHGTVVTAVSRCAGRGEIVPDGTALTSRGRQAVAYRVGASA